MGEAGEQIFGIKCSELVKAKVNDETEFRSVLKSCYFNEFRVKVKAYSEIYNGESRVKYMVQNIYPLDKKNHYAIEVNQLLNMLEF